MVKTATDNWLLIIACGEFRLPHTSLIRKIRCEADFYGTSAAYATNDPTQLRIFAAVFVSAS